MFPWFNVANLFNNALDSVWAIGPMFSPFPWF